MRKLLTIPPSHDADHDLIKPEPGAPRVRRSLNHHPREQQRHIEHLKQYVLVWP